VTFALERVGRRFAGRAGVVDALLEVSFQVQAGERVAVLGPSGAGKTTLFGVLNTTLRPSSGRFQFEGRDVSTLPRGELRAVRRRIGTVFQQPRLVPSLTARQNALTGRVGHWSSLQALGAALRPGKEDLRRADAALEAVGLSDRREARADELSGGEQQRVAIARVLVQEPTVVLADEPLASLDPALRASMAELLFGVAARAGTLVVVVHEVDFAVRHFPRLIGLTEGQVAFDAPTERVTAAQLERLYARAGATESLVEAELGDGDALACAR
jgi:phosphonate transport system ATP-binding protein